MVTAQNTRSSLEKLMTDSRSSLQTYRNSLNESLIPKLSQSMDTLSTLNGTLTATLSDVDPTVEQLKLILTQLDTSLSDSSAALGQTGGVLGHHRSAALHDCYRSWCVTVLRYL